MMRRFGFAGLCVAAVVALLGVSVASASASEPALFECAKAGKETVEWKEGTKTKKKAVYTGGYTEKKCATVATEDKYRSKGAHPGPEGKYELQEWNLTAKKDKPKAFKGTGGGANLYAERIGGVNCLSSSDEGVFTGPKTAGKIVATFKNCEYQGLKCKSGSTEGEIVTNPLVGEVGYLAGKGTMTPTVGADIKAESGEVLAKFNCHGDEFEVLGSLIGEVSPANEFSKKATFTFKQPTLGVQEWTKFEGGPVQELDVYVCNGCGDPRKEAEAKAAETDTTVNTGEELILKA